MLVSSNDSVARKAIEQPRSRSGVSVRGILYRAQHYALTASLALPRQVWTRVLAPRQASPSRAELALLRDRFEALLARDLAHAERGDYPRELLFQLPLLGYLRELPSALADLPAFLWRSYTGACADLPHGIDRKRYPRYYLRNFHWQRDGWFSERSARLYDPSVEFLFGGTADVMRRMAVPPLVRTLAGSSQPRVLDVGCGTGRFLAQLARSLPNAQLAGLDLSAPYLARAAGELVGLGVSLACDNAESMPWADAHFDAVSAVFLFHELPPDARRRVASEVWRVLAPGGLFVISDSAQLAESGELAGVLRGFAAAYHEPYYKSYLRDDFARWLPECGFEVLSAEPHFVSKVVVARKVSERRPARGSRRSRTSRAPARKSGRSRGDAPALRDLGVIR
jgi:ubiquinone/menaquinone biosynthesis C-methylase UbiE